MTKPKTLNELKRLEECGFGKPYPRHGLKLLYWFAHDCLYFDVYNKMCWQYDPEDRDFGFHLYENRIDKNGDQLLPEVEHHYYEVGNLSKAGANNLPDYVREDYNKNHNHHEGNMDRIIVSIDDERFDRVYVTEHSDWTDFNKEATYYISKGLIGIIRRLTLENFLKKTGYSSAQVEYGQRTGISRPQEDNSQRTLRKDTDQGTGHSTLSNVSDPNPECSIQIEDPSLLDHNKNNNRCRCIIL